MPEKPEYYKIFSEVDGIINNNNPQKDWTELEKLLKDKSIEVYFLNNTISTEWFSKLNENKYFSPSNAPGPIESEEKGMYRIPEWNVLQYLEKVSIQIKEKPVENGQYIDELLKIIKDVTNYQNDKWEHIDNDRTWWYFVKILCNLPNEKIDNEIINLILVWLESKFRTTLQGSEIVKKLLPKFLDSNNSDDWKKSEKIAEHSLATFPSKGEKEILKTVIDSYYLKESFLTKNNAEKLGKTCTNDFINNLSDNIKKLLKKDESNIFIEVNNDTYRFLLNDNNNSITIKISKAENKKKNDTIFMPKENWKEVDQLDITAKISGLKKKQFYELIIEKLKEKNLYETLVQNSNEKLFEEELIDLHIQLFNKEIYSSFYSRRHYFEHDVLDLLTEILKKTLVSKSKTSINGTKEILENYFNDNYLYFYKMALYIIGCDESNVNTYRDIYFKYLEADKYNILMDGIYFGDEIKHLFNTLKELDLDKKELIKRKIEEGPRKIYKMDIIIWKQERYEALKHDDYFKNEWDKCRTVTGRDEYQLFPAVGEIQTGVVKEISPLDYENISQMSVKEVVDFIKSYKPAERQDFFKSEGVAGLAGEISKAIQKDPKKFTDELNLFLDIGYYYIYSLIGNFRTLWVNKSPILDIEKILKFIKEYIEPDKFWKDELMTPDDEWKASHKWVVGMIGEFIQEGTRDDSWAFDEKYLPQIKDIIFFILDKIEADEPSENNDPVTDVLNTHQGKMINAFINYVLRAARLNDKRNGKKEINWGNDVKQKYETLLNKGIFEAYTLLGEFLPQFCYLDKKWVEIKIKEFETIQRNNLWELFLTGYLHISKIYNIIFNLMERHYLKALNYKFKNQHANEAVVQHIAVGYLRNLEVGNSIYEKLIDKWDYEQIKELLSFFWMQRDYKDEKDLRSRIIEFWKWVYENKYKGKQENELSSEDKKILSELCNLTVFLTEINPENFEWLRLLAPHIDVSFHSSFFIEYLDELKDKGESYKYIGKIYIEMLKNTTPDFRKEDILSIVKFLYDKKIGEQFNEANDICNTYGSHGSEILRDLYDKYNKNN